jgi:hypothetical protein
MAIGGIVPITTSSLQVANINGYYVGPNGEHAIRQTYETYSGPVAQFLGTELGKLKKTDLVDLAGMHVYVKGSTSFRVYSKGRL